MTTTASRRVRIGGASGFWGDSAIATPQLLDAPGLHYLVYDYLAETTMAILARARAKDASLGYATDFVQAAMAPHLRRILAQGVKVVANAGGLHPQACRDALLCVAAEQGLSPRVAVVTGDDLLPQADTLRAQGVRMLDAQADLPASLLSANAYVGARGIAAALATGADVVITGRCVDSAVVLGVLVHEYGWSWQDWDRLSAGTLAGHLIECGAQATGGLFTDWQQVPDWDRIGYPLIDVAADGSFELNKPEGTGGLLHRGAVAEQILYEIGDPARYLMPDVCCDWRAVRAEPTPDGTVRVSGARGAPPPPDYKANATWQDGYQLQLMLAIRGIDAIHKAERTAQALLARTRALLAQRGWGDYSETCVELLGAESHYGPHARVRDSREVVLRVAVRHPQARALGLLQRECASSGTSMGPGTRSSFFGRPDIQPVVKLCSFLVPKPQVRLQMTLDAQVLDVSDDGAGSLHLSAVTDAGRDAATSDVPAGNDSAAQVAVPEVEVRLLDLAWARSGDKGDDANIGVIARTPAAWHWLRAHLSAERVRAYCAHLMHGEALRYEMPGLQALNFVLQRALGGGGVCSLRSDPLGKSLAQMLLDMPLRVPVAVLAADAGRNEAASCAILQGVRVLDLTRVIAGPVCTQNLADMGATVYKIEKPGEGDDTRRMGPFLPDAQGRDSNESALYVAYNRGKQSLTVDISRPEGAQLVRDLAQHCDVLVENYKAGTLARYGLDAATLRARNPRLIYCSVTGFGQDGPYAARPAYDFILQGMAGPMSTCGQPEGAPGSEPMRTAIPVTDIVTGLYATIAILGALRHRERSGEGQFIDAAMLDASVALNGHLAVGYLMNGRVPARQGNTNPIAAPSEVLACADGHLIVAAGNNGQFAQLCALLGCPEVAQEPRFATNVQRIAHRAELRAILAGRVARWSRADLLVQLEAAGVPGGPINDMAQVFDDPQTRHRALAIELPHPCGQPVRLVRSPLVLSASPVTHRPPPMLGQHNQAVLRQVLGLEAEAIEALRARGVLG